MLSQVHSRVFQELLKVWYQNRFGAGGGATITIQASESSINKDIKEAFKMKTNATTPLSLVILENIMFYKSIIYLNR